MNRFSIIQRTVKSFLVEVMGLGGVTQNRFISPKGLFSKPVNEKAIVINMAGGRNQDAVIALQKDIELEDGDVYLTDDKSFIHYHHATGDITIETKNLKVISEQTIFETKEFIVNTKDFTVNTDNLALNSKDSKMNSTATDFSGAITNGGVPIDNTHQHTQTAGDHFGADGITTPPNS